MRHRAKTLSTILFVVLQFACATAFAIDSETDREKLYSFRNKRFFPTPLPKQTVSFGGSYISDYNSKQYEMVSRYNYQSSTAINELYFKHEAIYADSGSGANAKSYVKKSELYDFSFSSKVLIADSKNYSVFFHRTIYDDLSKYYYDIHTAGGLGRIFFNGRLELDVSLGYQDVKAYGHKLDVIPSIRTNFKLSKNLTLVQRGYLFVDSESMDSELKTSLTYRVNERLSFELRHSFEQRRYEEDDENKTTNLVNRSVTVSLVFDL
jgi:hypothetical protein